MDTTMQQAVSENPPTTTTLEDDNNTTTMMNSNGTNGAEESPELEEEEEGQGPVGEAPTYDQQFPSLGGGGGPLATAPPLGRWNKKPPLQSSIITQGKGDQLNIAAATSD